MSLSVVIAGQQGLVVTPIGATIHVAIRGNNRTAGVVEYEQAGTGFFTSTQGTPVPPLLNPTPYATSFDFFYYWNNSYTSPDVAATFAAAAAAGFTSPAWGTIPPTAVLRAENSWQIFNQNAQYSMFCTTGLGKNSTASPKSYFVALYKVGVQQNSPFVASGVTTLQYSLTLTDSGTINPGQVLGAGQDINLPYPGDAAWPLNLDTNSAIIRESYFGVIDQDPTVWATSLGLSFGTTTYVTT